MAVYKLKPVMSQLKEYVDIWNANEEQNEEDHEYESWGGWCPQFWGDEKNDYKYEEFKPSSIAMIMQDDLPTGPFYNNC